MEASFQLHVSADLHRYVLCKEGGWIFRAGLDVVANKRTFASITPPPNL